MSDIDEKRIQWEVDEPNWHYILETYWQLNYKQMLNKLAQFNSLEEAVEAAQNERGGMIAT